MISVVIPTYNRWRNLELVLTSLVGQDGVAPGDFEVIIADDGSNDRTFKVFEQFRDAGNLNIRYTFHAHDGFRAAFTRNQGARRSEQEYILFLDSDVVLSPAAIYNYMWLIERYTDVPLMLGRYDWMKPCKVTPEIIIRRWSVFAASELPTDTSVKVEGMQTGPDPRFVSPALPQLDTPTHDFRYATFSGNMLVKRDRFWEIGGFDEGMVGHGGEDCELGLRYWEAGDTAIFTELGLGYHLYHDRDQKRNEREVQKNIQYIIEKHPWVGKPEDPMNIKKWE